MRTLTRDRDTTTQLVRQRMDTLFEPAPRGRGREDETTARAPVAAATATPMAAAGPGPVPSPGPSPGPAPGPVPARRRLPLAVQERLDLDRRAVVGLSVLLVLGLGYGAQQFWAGRPEPVAVPTAEASAGASLSPPLSSEPSAAALSPSAAAGGGVIVDVAGRVREPGVRTLPAGARVQDALKAAGGAAPGTDLTGLNLARRLNDGEEIIVGAAPAAAAGGSAGKPAGPLSLNSATVEQLDQLPGIGPVLAQRIVQYRDQHGGFTSVDQLRKVSGFGERRLADLRAKLQP